MNASSLQTDLSANEERGANGSMFFAPGTGENLTLNKGNSEAVQLLRDEIKRNRGIVRISIGTSFFGARPVAPRVRTVHQQLWQLHVPLF